MAQLLQFSLSAIGFFGITLLLGLEVDSKHLKGPGSRAIFQDFVDNARSRRSVDNSSVSEASSSEEEDAAKVRFFLFNHKNQENATGYELYPNDTAVLLKSPYMKKVSVKVLVHGFGRNYQAGFPTDVKTAYLNQTKNLNLILVDWKDLAASPFYGQAIIHTKLVGNILGQLLENMIDNDYTSLEKIHLIGHSLGAHVCGIAGDRLKKRYGKQVSRISGLDPAKPAVDLLKKERRLEKTDAAFVDVIHTSVLGLCNPIGNIDYFPNGGKLQPGCGVDPSCSHSRAHAIFAESIYKPDKYKSCKCHTDILGTPVFLPGSCKCDAANNSTIAYMGSASKSPDAGVFYVDTVSNY